MQNNILQDFIDINLSDKHSKKAHKRRLPKNDLSALRQLAASFAHEFNNPLAGVLLYTKLLYKKISNDNISKGIALDYLSKMDSELTRTAGLIRDLKDYALELNLKFKNIEIKDVINQALESVEKSIEMNHIQISKVYNHTQSTIKADAEQLQRVFRNIIINAVQAMPDGGILSIRTFTWDRQLGIEIRDTGCGISKENIQNMFIPFFSSKSEVKSTGLGLATAYGVVKKHGGNIEVSSERGQGSTFTIFLPVYRGYHEN